MDVIKTTQNNIALPSKCYVLQKNKEGYSVNNVPKTITGDVVIAGDHNNKPVTEVEYGAFRECHDLLNITIPNTITRIESNAFCECTQLEIVKIPDSVTSIGYYAFIRCTHLKHIIISARMKFLQHSIFQDCSSLESVVIPKSIKTMHEYVFIGCDKATIYVEGERKDKPRWRTGSKTGWHFTWCGVDFPSYAGARPVVWGVILDKKGEFVVSLTKKRGSVQNNCESKPLSPPYRIGHAFLGWSISPDANKADEGLEYADTFRTKVKNGTTVYAVWEYSENNSFS